MSKQDEFKVKEVNFGGTNLSYVLREVADYLENNSLTHYEIRDLVVSYEINIWEWDIAIYILEEQ